MPVITFTTDFGQRDWFVGAMKGAALTINPGAVVMDLTHEIAPGDIRSGAFSLSAAYRFFPRDTVHVAVVDPGVGSRRKAIVIRTVNYFFVGPDNGVLSWAVRNEQVLAVHALKNDALFHKPVSRTFHGRDVFAPVAAHISRGISLADLGPAAKNYVELEWPEICVLRDRVEGEVVYVDRFGNALTNIDAGTVGELRLVGAGVFRGDKRLCGIADFYQAVPSGSPLAVIGSSGFLEVAVNGGNAAQRFRLRPGSKITLAGASSARQH